MTTMPNPEPPSPEDDFNAWLDWNVRAERIWRQEHPDWGDPDAPQRIVEEAVIQEVLRDTLYGCYPLMEYSARYVVERNPAFLEEFIGFKTGGEQGHEPSEAFMTAFMQELTARIHECLVNMRPPVPPNKQQEDEEE
jgi:hypothetical protein